jgi:hypothetical protein
MCKTVYKRKAVTKFIDEMQNKKKDNGYKMKIGIEDFLHE